MWHYSWIPLAMVFRDLLNCENNVEMGRWVGRLRYRVFELLPSISASGGLSQLVEELDHLS